MPSQFKKKTYSPSATRRKIKVFMAVMYATILHLFHGKQIQLSLDAHLYMVRVMKRYSENHDLTCATYLAPFYNKRLITHGFIEYVFGPRTFQYLIQFSYGEDHDPAVRVLIQADIIARLQYHLFIDDKKLRTEYLTQTFWVIEQLKTYNRCSLSDYLDAVWRRECQITGAMHLITNSLGEWKDDPLDRKDGASS